MKTRRIDLILASLALLGPFAIHLFFPVIRILACSRAFCFGSFVHFLHRQDRMSVGTSCSHFGGNSDRFHQFLSGSSMAKSRLGVTFNAVWALRHVCHCDGDQLFRSGRERPFSEYVLAECLEGLFSRR
jgi:hypothetical protein